MQELKKKNGWYLLGTLGVSLLGNMLTGKGTGGAGYKNKKG